MRLKYQIFLTLLAASAVLIATMFAFSSWSFSRGFLDYVKQNEINRLSPLVEELEYQYALKGRWGSVSELGFLFERGPGNRERAANGREDRLSDVNRLSDEDRALKPESTNRTNPRRSPPRNGRREPPPPLVLADIDKQVLIGKMKPKSTMQWIELQNNDQLIGYLGFPENSRVDRYFDQVFEDKQKNTFMWTALAMIVLSALLSIPLADRIVRPLLKVNKAVDEISGGNFKHRIDNSRQDELGDLANNINTLGVTLEQNRDARQRWIAEISHELRTPLAVMRGELEAVQDGVRQLDASAVDSLHSETLGLGRLVDDLHTLSMSDIGALDYQMNTLDLASMLNEFLTSNEQVLKQHDINLKTNIVHINASIQGDVQRLEQLFSNLLQNTCRYTDTGGKLEVTLLLDTVNGKEQLILDWFDSSPGVDTQLIPRLFEPLFRTELSRNRELGGSGLGLSIAKRIVEAHQASIVASESSLGGLHIQINFPLNTRDT